MICYLSIWVHYGNKPNTYKIISTTTMSGVLNLSNRPLSTEETSLLSRGLKFCLTPPCPDPGQGREDLEGDCVWCLILKMKKATTNVHATTFTYITTGQAFIVYYLTTVTPGNTHTGTPDILSVIRNTSRTRHLGTDQAKRGFPFCKLRFADFSQIGLFR